MSSIQVTVLPPLAQLLESFPDSPDGRVNAIANRYGLLIHHELSQLTFSRGEWCAIFDANNGCSIGEATGDSFASPVCMWMNVADTPDIGEKWGIDQGSLVKRMQGISFSACIAIYEACAIFWQHTDLPTDVAMTKAGVTWAA